MDAKTQAQLERGKRIVEIFKQPQYNPIPVEIQVAILWTLGNGHFDDVDVDRVKEFQDKLTAYLTDRKSDILKAIGAEQKVTDSIAESLKAAIAEFKETFK